MTWDLDREAYFRLYQQTTRWRDNDAYGHVNNSVYYSYFDSSANRYLIEEGGLDIQNSPQVALVVASKCEYFSPIRYPDLLEIGFRVNKLGTKSVEYGLAVFKQGSVNACAAGTFTHVFVDRIQNKSVPIPPEFKAVLELALKTS